MPESADLGAFSVCAFYDLAVAEDLKPRQRRAAEVVARGKTFEEAAREVGVAVRTLFAWRRSEGFQAAVRETQANLFAEARGELRAATTQAVRTLRDLVTDSAVSSSVRVRAALGILASAGRAHELDVLEERIARLEGVLQDERSPGEPQVGFMSTQRRLERLEAKVAARMPEKQNLAPQIPDDPKYLAEMLSAMREALGPERLRRFLEQTLGHDSKVTRDLLLGLGLIEGT